MIYKIGKKGLEDISVTENDKKNNLPVGTVLQLNGYSNPKYVVIKNLGINERFKGHGARYMTVKMDDNTFSQHDAFSMDHIDTKKDNRIHMYYTDEIIPEDEVEIFVQMAKQKSREAQEAKAEAEQTAALKEERGRELFAEYIPEDAVGLIVAQYEIDQCDLQTDYFATSLKRTVILGWSLNKRDNFKEMRKHADRIPETAHLKTPPEEYWRYGLADGAIEYYMESNFLEGVGKGTGALMAGGKEATEELFTGLLQNTRAGILENTKKGMSVYDASNKAVKNALAQSPWEVAAGFLGGTGTVSIANLAQQLGPLDVTKQTEKPSTKPVKPPQAVDVVRAQAAQTPVGEGKTTKEEEIAAYNKDIIQSLDLDSQEKNLLKMDENEFQRYLDSLEAYSPEEKEAIQKRQEGLGKLRVAIKEEIINLLEDVDVTIDDQSGGLTDTQYLQITSNEADRYFKIRISDHDKQSGYHNDADVSLVIKSLSDFKEAMNKIDKYIGIIPEAKSPSKQKQPIFKVGDRVQHTTFGQGKVIGRSKGAVKIKFDTGETKTIKEGMEYGGKKILTPLAREGITPPELKSEEISEIARWLEYGGEGVMKDMGIEAVSFLKEKGYKYVDGYHVISIDKLGEVMKKGIDTTDAAGDIRDSRERTTGSRPEGVYFFADPDDINAAIPYLSFKVPDEGGDVAVVHFRIPIKQVPKMTWDGIFNVTFGTYSSFRINKRIPKSWIQETAEYAIPSVEDYKAGKNGMFVPTPTPAKPTEKQPTLEEKAKVLGSEIYDRFLDKYSNDPTEIAKGKLPLEIVDNQGNSIDIDTFAVDVGNIVEAVYKTWVEKGSNAGKGHLKQEIARLEVIKGYDIPEAELDSLQKNISSMFEQNIKQAIIEKQAKQTTVKPPEAAEKQQKAAKPTEKQPWEMTKKKFKAKLGKTGIRPESEQSRIGVTDATSRKTEFVHVTDPYDNLTEEEIESQKKNYKKDLKEWETIQQIVERRRNLPNKGRISKTGKTTKFFAVDLSKWLEPLGYEAEFDESVGGSSEYIKIWSKEDPGRYERKESWEYEIRISDHEPGTGYAERPERQADVDIRRSGSKQWEQISRYGEGLSPSDVWYEVIKSLDKWASENEIPTFTGLEYFEEQKRPLSLEEKQQRRDDEKKQEEKLYQERSKKLQNVLSSRKYTDSELVEFADSDIKKGLTKKERVEHNKKRGIERNQHNYSDWQTYYQARARLLEHKKLIEKAIDEGLPVPPEVLAEYPEPTPGRNAGSTPAQGFMKNQINTLFGKLDEIAIQRLKAFEPSEGFWIAYSGGKDSDAVIDLVRRSGVKYDAPTADPPELVRHVKEQPDVKIHRPKRTMWELIKYNGMPPRRNARYCCKTQKESGGTGRIVVTGIRRAEGANRSNRMMVESCYRDKSKRYLNLIIDWTTTDIWQHIKSRNISYCSLYDEGFKRLGCVLCPMNREVQIHLERWPKICRAWERAIKATFKPNGHFKTPEEYWRWWLNRDAKTLKDKNELLFRDGA